MCAGQFGAQDDVHVREPSRVLVCTVDWAAQGDVHGQVNSATQDDAAQGDVRGPSQFSAQDDVRESHRIHHRLRASQGDVHGLVNSVHKDDGRTRIIVRAGMHYRLGLHKEMCTGLVNSARKMMGVREPYRLPDNPYPSGTPKAMGFREVMGYGAILNGKSLPKVPSALWAPCLHQYYSAQRLPQMIAIDIAKDPEYICCHLLVAPAAYMSDFDISLLYSQRGNGVRFPGPLYWLTQLYLNQDHIDSTPRPIQRISNSPRVAMLPWSVQGINNEEWRNWPLEAGLPESDVRLYVCYLFAGYIKESLLRRGQDLVQDIQKATCDPLEYRGIKANQFARWFCGFDELHVDGTALPEHGARFCGVTARDAARQDSSPSPSVPSACLDRWVVRWGVSPVHELYGLEMDRRQTKEYNTVLKNFHLTAFALGWFFEGRFRIPQDPEAMLTHFESLGFKDRVQKHLPFLTKSGATATNTLRLVLWGSPLFLLVPWSFEDMAFMHHQLIQASRILVLNGNALTTGKVFHWLGSEKPTDLKACETAIMDTVWILAKDGKGAHSVVPDLLCRLEAIVKNQETGSVGGGTTRIFEPRPNWTSMDSFGNMLINKRIDEGGINQISIQMESSAYPGIPHMDPFLVSPSCSTIEMGVLSEVQSLAASILGKRERRDQVQSDMALRQKKRNIVTYIYFIYSPADDNY
ncbi:hypothetical protein B0H11DRAFT_1926357 [Mycena galericulata]|nr:hypothetical protein B0H11DRAFT_1926357 [Mycena galericulata]